MKELNLGLDIGTNSIGWALVDENGDVIKKNGFRFWGVRMFDEADTAKERRTNRSSRRRLRRRRQRIEWLQEEFRDEINKVDDKFFQRLNDSFYIVEDKQDRNHYTFFDDVYTDQNYFEQFPTIYHLRKYLMETEEKADIRMIYLALHHIIKYRGHFLNEGESFNPSDFEIVENVLKELNDELKEYKYQYEDEEDYFSEIDLSDANFFIKLQDIMLSKSSKMEKEDHLRKLMKVDKKSLVNELVIKLLVSGKVSPKSFSFVKDQKYQTKDININIEDGLQESIDENKKTVTELSTFFDYIENIKLVSDFYYLLKLLGINPETKKCNQSLSDAMINTYKRHQSNLEELKSLIKTYLPNSYNDCFRIYKKGLNNYVEYVGKLSTNGETKRFAHCSKENFESYVKKLLTKISDEKAKQTIDSILKKIENNEYMPRQNNGQNTTIPMQLNLMELKKIIDNQSKYYPFLLEEHEGYTRRDRIISIFEYHIPYYVGPLSNANNNQFSWIERKPLPIRPWNFNEVVDIEKSATIFIQRMQNKCTYLHGPNDYCLPKMSLLFTEYNCLQYLNKIRINGALINQAEKQEIFNEFFLNNSSPTKSKLIKFIYCKFGMECEDLPEINCNMSSWIKFKEIFKDEFNKRVEDGSIEEIIKDITLFEDKKILAKRFKEVYHLTEEQIKAIKGLNYKGYGALCRKLLDGIRCVNKKTGEESPTIIEIMRNTNLNLMEIIYSQDYPFLDAIDEYNKKVDTESLDFRTYIDENLYVSPMMKRSLIQTYRLIEEIERIFKRPINKYYIECTRTNQAAKKPTNSRYQHLLELYRDCKNIANDLEKQNIDLNHLSKQLEEYKDKLSIDALYLYFTQLGKCMYTLKDIENIDSVMKGIGYDIDHIYPQSLVKDDSFSNIVLVDKDTNQNVKKNRFLCETTIVTGRHKAFYKILLDKKLITKEKYRRLTETRIDDTTLEGFVNRQLVATNQAVKGVIQLLKRFKNVSNSNIIYSKAENVSDFRNEYDMLKSRTANNFHHAHDAYLNVIIGRAINTYYEVNRILSIKDVIKIQNEEKTLNPITILKCRKVYDLKGQLVWDKSLFLPKIENYLYHTFDIHETTRTNTSNKMFSKVTVLPKGQGTVLIKSNDSKISIAKYGGITSYSYCKYCIVEGITKKNEKEYILESIPTSYKNRVNEYIDSIYSKKYLQYKIIKGNIPTNLIIKNGALKFYITGKTNDSYLIKNANDRYFSKNAIRIIRSIDKYNDQVQKKCAKEEVDNKIIVSPSKLLKDGKTTKEISITMDDCLQLLDEIKKLYSKEIFAYSPIITLVNRLNEICDYENYTITEMVKIISQILLLLKTNERKMSDLTIIDLAKNFGFLAISKKLSPGMKLIAESLTGYFTETIFEVPDAI